MSTRTMLLAIAPMVVSTSATTTFPAGAVPAAESVTACADLGGTVDDERICQVQNVTATHEIDFSFPVDHHVAGPRRVSVPRGELMPILAQ